jgi:hypothetical protein
MARPKYRQSEHESNSLPSQDQRLSIPSEGAMKVQTDVKAGFGLLGILVDIDIDINLGGGRSR